MVIKAPDDTSAEPPVAVANGEEFPLLGADDAVPEGLRRVVRDHWMSLYTSAVRGQIQLRYNYLITNVRDFERFL